MEDFYRIKRLPPYVLAAVIDQNEHRIREAVRGIRAVLG